MSHATGDTTPTATTTTTTAAERHANARARFGAGLDELINECIGRAPDADLIACLEGRADRIRREIGARQLGERRRRALEVGRARERAIETVAQATGVTVELVRDVLLGERVAAAPELVAEILEVAARLAALQPDLRARQRAIEARPVAELECHPSPSAAAALGKAVEIIGRRAR